MEDTDKMNHPTSDQPFDEPHLSPTSPVTSVELSKDLRAVSVILPQNSQYEGKKTFNHVSGEKRVASSNPPRQLDGEGFGLSSKAVPGKTTEFAAAYNLSKKGGPAKKLRATSNTTPSIKSYFKPATTKDT